MLPLNTYLLKQPSCGRCQTGGSEVPCQHSNVEESPPQRPTKAQTSFQDKILAYYMVYCFNITTFTWQTTVCFITDDSDEINNHFVCITQNPHCWLTGRPRLQTTDSSLAKSSPASTMVLLDVRLLLGANRHNASTESGSFIATTSFRKSFALAPGVDEKPKVQPPMASIGTMRSTQLRKWESPTISTA